MDGGDGWCFLHEGFLQCPITDSFPSKIYSTSVVVSALVDLTPRDRSHACGVSKLYTRAFAEISQRKRWLIVQAILPCERSHGNLGITMKNPLNNIGLISVSLSLLTNCVESKNTEGGGSHGPEITLTSTSSSEESVTSASSGEAVTGIVSGGTESSSASDGGDSQTSEVTSDCSAPTTDTSDSGSPACDPWEQDCPECQKCSPAIDGDGDEFNSAKCVPLEAIPAHVGEACLASGVLGGGIDNCERGSICWYLTEDGVGICISLCSGDASLPKCGDGSICVVGNEFLNLCIERCNPLVDACSQVDNVCLPYDPYGFICRPDAWLVPGAKYSPCEINEQCDLGNGCFSVLLSPQCDQGAAGCCMPFCDIDQPEKWCSVRNGEKCVPYYEGGETPDGYENLGVCSVGP